MQYDSDRNFMNLKVLGALNLPFRNTEKQTPPDPYVKVCYFKNMLFYLVYT